MSEGTYQQRVHAWVADTFPETLVEATSLEEDASNPLERARRFLEEALELVQAVGLDQAEVAMLSLYTYSRPVGELAQEMGGARLSMAALAASLGLDADECGEVELARVSAPGMRERMRAKHQTKVDEGVGTWGA